MFTLLGKNNNILKPLQDDFLLDESSIIGYNNTEHNIMLLYIERRELNMKKYVTPEMEITEFEAEDVITTSPAVTIGGEDD